jgi:flagellar motor switch protein FliN/FliY
MMSAPEITEVHKSFGKKFGVVVSSALTEASASNWQLSVVEEPSVERPLAAEAGCYRFSFEGSLEGEAFLILKHGDLPALALGQAASGTASSKESQLSEMLSALQGGAAGLEKVLSEHGSVLVSVELVEDFELPDGPVIEFSARADAAAAQVPFFLSLEKKLETALHALSAKTFVFPSAAESTAANLDLVLDVELNVTLRFGQRQLALREVLDLTSGSVVELDRQVDEPVELVLDGKVVARGEAVIIDGNYGIRITQVIQPIEF